MTGLSKYFCDSNRDKQQAQLEVKGHLPKHDAYGSLLFSIHEDRENNVCAAGYFPSTTILFCSPDGDTLYTCI